MTLLHVCICMDHQTSVRLRRNFNRPDLPAKLSYITSGQEGRRMPFSLTHTHSIGHPRVCAGIAIGIGCIWLLKAIIVGTHMLLL